MVHIRYTVQPLAKMDLRSAVIAVTTLLLAVHVHPIHASWKVLDTTTPIKISDMTTTAVGDAIYMLGVR